MFSLAVAVAGGREPKQKRNSAGKVLFFASFFYTAQGLGLSGGLHASARGFEICVAVLIFRFLCTRGPLSV